MKKKIFLLCMVNLLVAGCNNTKYNGDSSDITITQKQEDVAVRRDESDDPETVQYQMEGDCVEGKAKVHIKSYQDGVVTFSIENLADHNTIENVGLLLYTIDEDGAKSNRQDLQLDMLHLESGTESADYTSNALAVSNSKKIVLSIQRIDFQDEKDDFER